MSHLKEGAMKWMMPSVGVLVAAVLSGSAAAQSASTGANGAKMDKMAMNDTTYTGCVEAGGAPGTFTLTHLAADDRMGKDAMKKDTMTKDSMSKDAMAPSTLALSSSSVDLNKHLGHKVSVTGSAAQGKMDAMGKDAMGKGAPAFTATSLKMVAASCP
jgi:hypothetical protein